MKQNVLKGGVFYLFANKDDVKGCSRRIYLCDSERANKINVDELLELFDWQVEKRCKPSGSCIVDETIQGLTIQSSPHLQFNGPEHLSGSVPLMVEKEIE